MIPHFLDKKTETILKSLPTPCYVLDEARLTKNLELLASIQRRTGAKILLAQKCFSTTALYPLISSYLAGCVASGLYEARLGHEFFKKENHVFEPAYHAQDMEEIAHICDHVIFNSWSQFAKHKHTCRHTSIGIRINPECSTQCAEHAIYDPCVPGSRLGIRIDDMPAELPAEIEGFHMHTLCEQNVDALLTTFKAVESRFGKYLLQLKWLNLGGGHYIAHDAYGVEKLVELLNYIRETYKLQVYLEPGEGVVLNAGYVVTEVMDKVHNGLDILILDTSAACHFPDVIEGPYLPPIYAATEVPGGNALLLENVARASQDKLPVTGVENVTSQPCSTELQQLLQQHPYLYRLSSMTCLAGDVIGDYCFDREIAVGDKLVLEDMALYTIVKNNTFNGMPLPAIWLLHHDGSTELVKRFGYEDFRYRLG